MALRVVETGRAPEAIDLRTREVLVAGERVPFEALVSTVPLDVFVRLLVDAPADVRAAATQPPPTPSTARHLGWWHRQHQRPHRNMPRALRMVWPVWLRLQPHPPTARRALQRPCG